MHPLQGASRSCARSGRHICHWARTIRPVVTREPQVIHFHAPPAIHTRSRTSFRSPLAPPQPVSPQSLLSPLFIPHPLTTSARVTRSRHASPLYSRALLIACLVYLPCHTPPPPPMLGHRFLPLSRTCGKPLNSNLLFSFATQPFLHMSYLTPQRYPSCTPHLSFQARCNTPRTHTTHPHPSPPHPSTS